MQLPATASSALPSAFDLVGGECFAGPPAGRPSSDLARSDGANDAFDDLLTDALGGAESLAFLGLNATPSAIPATVAPPEPERSNAADAGLPATTRSNAEANNVATNARQLVLGGSRLPADGAPASVPAGEPWSGVETAAHPAIPALSQFAPADVSASPVGPPIDDGVADASTEAAVAPNESAAVREVNAARKGARAVSSETNEALEPVLLSLSHRRLQVENAASLDAPPPRRESHSVDQSARDQLLPFAPIVEHNGKATADGGSRPAASSVVAVGEQSPAAPIDGAGPISTTTDEARDAGDQPITADAERPARAEIDADSTIDPGDVTLVSVEAAMGSASAVSGNTPPAGREDGVRRGIVSPAGEIERRGPGARTLQARAGADSSNTVTDAASGENAVSAMHPIRPRPETLAAERRNDDTDAYADLNSQASTATQVSGDATATPEPAAAEPSVVQQVSQALETWRDALQEQGSARFTAWLSPPDLGHVWVELTRSGDGITARLKASDDSVQTLLESQEPELRQALNDSGITVADLDLSGRATGHFASDHRHQQPEQHEDSDTPALESAGPVQRRNPTKRASAVDVRA